ncbi:hypothetical protein [Microbispora sp. KK1-11]|uniref:hypothetical protein n=1 Tax=Microbispora sp. KK1-11 TaxID=2053005 RepID=UPI00163D1CB3|nr:hypothetical protein [Microbispora sp. KK1-11]
MKSLKRAAAAIATVAVAVTAFGVLSSPAEARPREPKGYPCWIEDYGWMTCYDVP